MPIRPIIYYTVLSRRTVTVGLIEKPIILEYYVDVDVDLHIQAHMHACKHTLTH